MFEEELQTSENKSKRASITCAAWKVAANVKSVSTLLRGYDVG